MFSITCVGSCRPLLIALCFCIGAPAYALSSETAKTSQVELCPLGADHGLYTSADCQFYLGTKAYRHQRFALAAAHWQEVLDLPLESAAELRAKAQSTLGFLYFYGKGLKQDKTRAIRLWQTAAQQGAAEAFLHLGHAYQQDDFFARDPVTALAWYLAMQRKYPVPQTLETDHQLMWAQAQQHARTLAERLSPQQRQQANQQVDSLLAPTP